MNPIDNVPQQEVNLSDYIKILLRRRKVIVTGFLSVFILAALYTFLMKPVYEASSSVYVKDDKTKIDEMSSMLMMGKSASIQAEIEIIKSRTIAENVVRNYHLDWQVKPSSSIASSNFLTLQSTLPWSKDNTSYLLTMTGPDSFVVTDADDKVLGNGKSGIPFQHFGLSLQVQLYGKKGDTFTLKRLNFNRAVEGLQNGCKVAEVVKMSNVIKIAYQNTDPVLSRNVVNGLVQEYLSKSLLFKTQEASRSVNFIEMQLQGVKDDMQRAETKLQEYKSSTGVVQLDAEAKNVIDSFS
ncbi:MAG: Wzz/FepE/Etk N-terminal domain-containing protein, partial [Chlorobiales bacterium]|nr:Wzz/FepE/Etk N-terminal domain-containing protein [Chlorobiales bacterium]